MAKIKLFGLVLIITTLILAMAVMVTETFEIRIHRLDTSKQNSPMNGPSNSQAPSATESEFVEIPIFVPLTFAGGLGLLFWFVPGGLSAVSPSPQPRGKRRRSGRR